MKTAFIGVGNMATAIINGMLRSAFPVSDIILYNRTPEKLLEFKNKGAVIAKDIKDAVSLADCIFLCVKPQNFPEVLSEISSIDRLDNKVFVTVAAGISSSTVSDAAHGAPVVRAMPNTPMLIGQGVIALCKNKLVSELAFEEITNIFSACGKVIKIDEADMNKIISVTGSSPAYVFLMVQAMYEGAVKQGLLDGVSSLSQKDILDGICDTLIGSLMLMKSGTKTPSEQISTVASKGGTTERALSELAKYQFSEAIVSAMEKCTERADELGK